MNKFAWYQEDTKLFLKEPGPSKSKMMKTLIVLGLAMILPLIGAMVKEYLL